MNAAGTSVSEGASHRWLLALGLCQRGFADPCRGALQLPRAFVDSRSFLENLLKVRLFKYLGKKSSRCAVDPYSCSSNPSTQPEPRIASLLVFLGLAGVAAEHRTWRQRPQVPEIPGILCLKQLLCSKPQRALRKAPQSALIELFIP